MADDLDPTPALRALVAQLGARDRSAAWTAEAALASMGEAGVAAATWGLSHPQVHVRRGCAGFMDHHGTDACFAPLRQAALHDPAPSVRRMAVHSATCQECKACPLMGDLVGLLIEVACSDTNMRVRLHALWGLHRPRDVRVIAALDGLLRDADPGVQLAACTALMAQDPDRQGDPMAVHVRVALSDADAGTRLRALWGLRHLPRDTRAVAAIEQILRTETDPRVRSYAHHALKHQDPGYKATVDAQARERGMSNARARPHRAD